MFSSMPSGILYGTNSSVDASFPLKSERCKPPVEMDQVLPPIDNFKARIWTGRHQIFVTCDVMDQAGGFYDEIGFFKLKNKK